MTPELDSAENLSATVTAGETDHSELPDADGASPEAGTAASEQSDTEIAAAVHRLADSAEHYHDRAQQREGVIDYLRSELELLRRGERRGLLRPLPRGPVSGHVALQ